MTLEKLNTFQKYCDNRMNYEMFKRGMIVRYGQDERYIEDRWQMFTRNPIQFITSRNEVELFDFIIDKIETTNYKG